MSDTQFESTSETLRKFVKGEADVVAIRSSSPAYKGYLWWLEHGGQRARFRENICQFFWPAIYRWFAHIPVIWKIKPWMIVVCIPWMFLFVFQAGFRAYQISITVIYLVFLALIQLRVFSTLKKILDRGMTFFGKKIVDPVMEWLFTTEYRWRIRPYMVFVAGALALYVYKTGVQSAAINAFALIIAVVFTIILGFVVYNFFRFLGFIGRKLKGKRSSTASGQQKHVEDKGMGTASQLFVYLVAKKKRYCPFILLPGDPGHPETPLES